MFGEIHNDIYLQFIDSNMETNLPVLYVKGS